MLRVNDNRLQDAGARAVASVLKENRSLCQVDLSSNGVGPAGVGPVLIVLERRSGPGSAREGCFD